jgi:hypothetical protein
MMLQIEMNCNGQTLQVVQEVDSHEDDRISPQKLIDAIKWRHDRVFK